jgi:hypothetical protein
MASASGPNNPIVVGAPQALKDTTGATTGITITQTTGIAYQQGAPSPATDQTAFSYNVPSISKYFSANICYSWAYAFSASNAFEIAGFSSTDEVELNILSSRGANGATAYTTSRLCSFTATGSGAPVVVSNYQPAGNYSNIATLTSLHPDANGKITLTIASATGATLMNAMRIARVVATGPVLGTSVGALSAFNYVEGNGPSVNQTFTINGSLLTADVTVNASTNYEISTDGITYSSSSLNLVQTTGTLATTTIYVRLKANAIIGKYNENITIQSAGATTRNVACSGSVTSSAVPPPPSPTQQINLSPSASRATTLALKTRTWSSTIGNASVCMWKDDKEGAFSITIDDNIQNQVNDWIANTEGTDVKLTWFLINQGGSWPTNWDPNDVKGSNVSNYSLYANALTKGHNVGGHDNRNWYGSGLPAGVVLPDSVKYIDRIIATKNEINTNLTTPTNGYSCLTYAYPYGSFPLSVNGDPWARNQFIALRGVLGGSNKAENANYQNLQITELLAGYPWRDNYVRTLFVDKSIGLFNRNNYRGWNIHLFHSLNSQASKDSALNLVRYLDLKKDSIWAGGFQNVAQYAQSRDTHHLTSSVVDASHIKFTLTDDMNDAMFNYPLTVKVVVPVSWKSAVAIQKGDTLTTRFLTYNGNQYLFVDAVPDGGEVTITGSDVLAVKSTLINATMNVYPNPIVGDYVNVKLPNTVSNERVTVELFDTKGLLISRMKTANENILHLNLSRFPKQIYILKCSTPNWNASSRIVKL